MKIPPFLYVIFGLFALFVGWSISVTPYRTPGLMAFQRDALGNPAQIVDIGNPDERQHANYISYLLREKSLPVIVPGDPNLGEMYQSHQAPLYYLVACILGDPTTPGGEKTRYLSLLFGLGSVVAIYFFGRIASGREDVGLACAAFCLLPGFTMLQGAISNDPLLIFLCSAAMAVMAQIVCVGRTSRLLLAAGVLVGLAILTKTSGLMLIPVLFLALFLARGQEEKASPLLAIVPSLLLPLPFFVRNTQLYGDPLGQKVFREAFTGNPYASMFIEGMGAQAYWTQMVGWWTSRSFVGAFGYMDIFYSVNLYRIAFALIFLCLVGWLIANRKQEEAPSRPAIYCATALILFAALLFVQFNLIYFQGQARYLLPAAVGIFFFLGVGIQGWFGKEKPYGWMVAVGILSALQIYTLTSVLPMEFERRKLALNIRPINVVSNILQIDIPPTSITNQLD